MANPDIDGSGQCNECARRARGKDFCLDCRKCSFCCTCEPEASTRTCPNCRLRVTADMLCRVAECGGCRFCCNHVVLEARPISEGCTHDVDERDRCLTCRKCFLCCDCSQTA